jgi:hypothetical protein
MLEMCAAFLSRMAVQIERAELDEHYDAGRFPGLRNLRRHDPTALRDGDLDKAAGRDWAAV